MCLREGNVFTPVCDSVHREVSVQEGGLCPGGGSLSRGVSVRETPLYGKEQVVRPSCSWNAVLFKKVTSVGC